MAALLLLVELYFAAMLGVSGLAKLDAPEHFEATLRVHRLWPAQAIRPVSRIFPWLEVVVAIALIIGFAPAFTAMLTLLLFGIFLSVETILVVTRRATECACYGVAYRQKVDGASLIVSVILVTLAAFYSWGLAAFGSPEPLWRWPGSVLMMVAGLWLVAKMLARRRGYQGRR